MECSALFKCMDFAAETCDKDANLPMCLWPRALILIKLKHVRPVGSLAMLVADFDHFPSGFR